MREVYYLTKMPGYVDGIVKRGSIPPSLGEMSLRALGVEPQVKRLKKGEAPPTN